jgi:hypothetical protein
MWKEEGKERKYLVVGGGNRIAIIRSSSGGENE